MNYRKHYEQHFNVKVPKDFDVHHIDGDRNNNDIINLVALPRVLHNKYHSAKYSFHISFKEQDVVLSFDNCNMGFGFELIIIKEMHESLRECFQYILYRDILLGTFPMHILTIEKPY
tara:strand:+ start:251 stop:601 length:351 start_codon:yes stop_codon:yes gene_type:complete